MDNCCILSSEAVPWGKPSSTQESGTVVVDSLIWSYSIPELTWQWKEGPCTGLPLLTEQTQWLIRPLQPPSGETLKCLVFEMKLQSLKLLPGGGSAWCSVVYLIKWRMLTWKWCSITLTPEKAVKKIQHGIKNLKIERVTNVIKQQQITWDMVQYIVILVVNSNKLVYNICHFKGYFYQEKRYKRNEQHSASLDTVSATALIKFTFISGHSFLLTV